MDLLPDIWVVLPASRPEMCWRAIGNFNRQRYPRKRLLVVENGEAVGAYKGYASAREIITSSASHAVAKNEGLQWLRERHPDAYWAAMDDDDYYSENYLLEHAVMAQHGRVVGKKTAWVQFNLSLVYFGNNWNPGDIVSSLMGGTMGCYVAEAEEFPDRCAEEHGFCRDAARSGMEIVTSSPKFYCYSREGDPKTHVWRASEEKMWRRLGGKGVRVVGDWRSWLERDPPSGPLENFAGEEAA